MIRILVVEDSETQRVEMQGGLEAIFKADPEKAEYRYTTKLEEAIVICREWAPHLVLLDLNLPDSDATATARRIPELEHKPCVVALTSLDTAELAMLCRTNGADIFAHKSLLKDRSQFVCHISNAISRKIFPPLYAR